MIQVIKRHEGHKSDISTIEGGRPQISYNSDGHIVVRLIHGNERDTLIVLDEQSSQQVIHFAGKIGNKNCNCMPF